MDRALLLAEQAAIHGEVPVGAIVVRDGVCLGEGYNQPISTNDPTAHAEVIALRAAAVAVGNYRLPGATLYVTVEPCTMCAGALVHARIARLVYGTVEPKAGAVESATQTLAHSAMNHRVDSCGGVRAQQAAQQLHAFFAQRRTNQQEPAAHD
ncbi:MAG: tRNA adenosine(34) deaminase TadA [Pseudomonadales bacterium]